MVASPFELVVHTPSFQLLQYFYITLMTQIRTQYCKPLRMTSPLLLVHLYGDVEVSLLLLLLFMSLLIEVSVMATAGFQ